MKGKDSISKCFYGKYTQIILIMFISWDNALQNLWQIKNFLDEIRRNGNKVSFKK